MHKEKAQKICHTKDRLLIVADSSYEFIFCFLLKNNKCWTPDTSDIFYYLLATEI